MTEAAGETSVPSFPWLDHYSPSVPHTIDDRLNRTLVDMFEHSCAEFADRPALESFGVRLSYAQVGKIADNVAGFLQSRGLQKGDRVAIMMPNIAAYIPLIFGVLKAGGVVVNTNPLYTVRELTHQMRDSDTKFIFYISLFEKTVKATHEELSFKEMVRVEPGDLIGLKGKLISFLGKKKAGVKKSDRIPAGKPFTKILKEGAAHGLKPIDIVLDDLAFLQYTGGTTGVSKGAMLNHSNVLANVEMVTSWFSDALKTQSRPQIMIAALPLYHIFALTACAFFMMRIGGSSLLIANPRDLDGFISTLRKRPFTIFVGLNTLFNALLDKPAFAKIDFTQMLLCVAGGMATKPVVAEKWHKITGHHIVEGYGLSETSPGVTFNKSDIEEFTGTIGFPWPSTEVQVRELGGAQLPLGEIGEICIKGPQVMSGYWNRPDETAQAMTPDGFFRSGDMGFMQPDGQIKLVDRLKEMIIVSGFNVYPNEIENAIMELPAVGDCAVVGLPDDHSGEAVTAFVVKRDEALSEEDVREFCKQSLTAYKVPKRVFFRDELPKSNVGKVLRRVLKENELKARSA